MKKDTKRMIQYLEVLYLYCPVCWKLLNIIRKCKNKVEKCLRILFNILNYLWVILINGNTTYGPTHTQITPTFLVLSQHIFQHSLAVSDKRNVRYFGKCWDEKWISVRANIPSKEWDVCISVLWSVQKRLFSQ